MPSSARGFLGRNSDKRLELKANLALVRPCDGEDIGGGAQRLCLELPTNSSSLRPRRSAVCQSPPIGDRPEARFHRCGFATAGPSEGLDEPKTQKVSQRRWAEGA